MASPRRGAGVNTRPACPLVEHGHAWSGEDSQEGMPALPCSSESEPSSRSPHAEPRVPGRLGPQQETRLLLWDRASFYLPTRTEDPEVRGHQ